jgi:hypothetical protein
LSEEVLRALAVPAQEATIPNLVIRLFEGLGDSGHARLLAWRGLTLDEARPEDSEQAMLRQLTDALHSRRAEDARTRGTEVPTREDSAFVVRLLGAALLGDAVAGAVFNLRAEVDHQRDPQQRFRAWLAEVVSRHIAGDVATSEDS